MPDAIRKIFAHPKVHVRFSTFQYAKLKNGNEKFQKLQFYSQFWFQNYKKRKNGEITRYLFSAKDSQIEEHIFILWYFQTC